MDTSKSVASNPSPKLYANILSRLTFQWLYPLLKHAKYYELETKDVYNILPEDECESVAKRLESCWKRECWRAGRRKKEPHLLRALLGAFGLACIKYGISLLVLNLFIRISQPFVLSYLLSCFNQDNAECSVYLYATSFVGLLILQVFFTHQINFGLDVNGMRLKTACSALVYRKITRLRSSWIFENGTFILNLFTKDIAELEHLFVSALNVCVIPLQVVIITILLWTKIGFVSLVGIGAMLLIILPFEYLLRFVASKYDKKIVAVTDKRIFLIKELINGIKFVKIHVWEKPYEQIVSTIRRKEVEKININMYLKGTSLSTLMFTNLTTLFFTLIALYIIRFDAEVLSTEVIFLIVYYYYIMQLSITDQFPKAVHFLKRIRFSIRNVEKFLLLDEVERPRLISNFREPDDSVVLKDVNYRWSHKSNNTLKDINVVVASKDLCLVTGPEKSGKTSMLKLLSNGITQSAGQIHVPSKISYAGQRSWLLNGSARANILYGEPYDEERYQKVCEICHLKNHFKFLKTFDDIIVGVGGQVVDRIFCAKINLARAVYKKADLYLIDNLWSDMESSLVESIFQECIVGFLSGKTRIVVNQNVDCLEMANHIIYLNEGQVWFQGSFNEFQNDNRDFIKLMLKNTKNSELSKAYVGDKPRNANIDKLEKSTDEPKETEGLIKKNNKFQSSLIWRYFKASRSPYNYSIVITLVCTFITLILFTISTHYTAYWANWAANFNDMHGNDSNETTQINLEDDYEKHFVIFTITLTISFLMHIINSVVFFNNCLQSNTNIHKTMMNRTLNAPMRLLSSNHSGIVRMFSEDMKIVDAILPVKMLQTILWCLFIIVALFHVVIANWITIFPILILLYFYQKAVYFYIPTIEGIKNLEGQTSITDYVTSTLQNVKVAPSIGYIEETMHREFDARLDNCTETHSLLLASSSSFSLWIDVISVIFIAVISSIFVLRSNAIDAVSVGMALTQAVNLCGSVRACLKSYFDANVLLKKVKQMMETEGVEQEMDEQLLQRVPLGWPTKGEVRFERLKINQKEISFSVAAGTKVGIVGCSEEEKYLLVSAIFRLNKTEGLLKIDDVDITKIYLHYLRQKMSIIPENPVIFPISLRKNLDALNKFDDSKLWMALDTVGLNAIFQSLDMPIKADDLTHAQRRLITFARAFLENNRVVVLEDGDDEQSCELSEELFERCTIIGFLKCLDKIKGNWNRVIVLEGEGELSD